MLKHINKENFEEEVLKSEKIIIVDFFAEWCGPCKMLGPVLEKIAQENSEFEIGKLDIDDAQEIAINYGVQVVPTMMIFKNGQVVDIMEGLCSKTEIVEKVSKYVDVK